jgi:predicted enzyme related to lactoylglutathione lyase
VGEVSEYPVGAFCWIDLGTTDVDDAKRFYGGLLGWSFQDLPPEEGGPYAMCRANGKDVAGIHSHTPEEGTAWSSCVTVGSVDDTIARAVGLGATVTAEPVDLPGTSRVAVIRDPVGADLTLREPRGYAGAQLVNDVGCWSWNELSTTDFDRSVAFHTELFGWTVEQAPGGLKRAAFTLERLLVCGIHEGGPGEPNLGQWTVAFTVADADDAAATVERLGGRVLLPPMDIPVGRFGIGADPQGAAFSIASAPGGPLRGVDGS